MLVWRRVSATGRPLHFSDSVTAMTSILVAEDSPTQTVVIRNLLSAAGFDVHSVINGVEALKSLVELRPQPC